MNRAPRSWAAAEAVGDRLAGFKGDEAARAPAAQIPLIGGVGVEDRGHDPLSPGVGEEFVAVAEQAPGGDQELNLHPGTHRGHLQQVSLPGAHLLNDRPHRVGGHVHHQALHGLALHPVDLLVEDPGGETWNS